MEYSSLVFLHSKIEITPFVWILLQKQILENNV